MSVHIKPQQQPLRGSAPVNEQTIKEFYDLTMQFFNQGVTAEETKRPKDAMDHYEQGVQLAAQVLLQYNNQISATMREQLNKYKSMIEGRLRDLRQEYPPKEEKWSTAMWNSLFQVLFFCIFCI